MQQLPKLAEYDDVPYLVYDDDKRGPIAITYYGQESGLLPEIIFEGEEIGEERFVELAKQYQKEADEYQEVLTFYKQLQS